MFWIFPDIFHDEGFLEFVSRPDGPDQACLWERRRPDRVWGLTGNFWGLAPASLDIFQDEGFLEFAAEPEWPWPSMFVGAAVSR